MPEFFLTPAGKERVKEGSRWRPCPAGHFLMHVWDERAKCYRFGCGSCAHEQNCPLQPILSCDDPDAKISAAMDMGAQAPEKAAAVFAALLPWAMGQVLRPGSQNWSVPGFGQMRLPDLRARERLISLLSSLSRLAGQKLAKRLAREGLDFEDNPQETVAWSAACFWAICLAAWQSADVMLDLWIEIPARHRPPGKPQLKLELGWHVQAPSELAAACCEALLMIMHNIPRPFGVCGHCGAFFKLKRGGKQKKAGSRTKEERRRRERICPECRQRSSEERRKKDRERKRSITPEARFFNTLNQAKRRGRISPEDVEILKQTCREKGVEAAREEYERRKLKRSG